MLQHGVLALYCDLYPVYTEQNDLDRDHNLDRQILRRVNTQSES